VVQNNVNKILAGCCMVYGRNMSAVGLIIARQQNAIRHVARQQTWPTLWALAAVRGISGRNMAAVQGITCKDTRIQEARICLTKDLEPRRCGADVIRDCTLDRALFEAID